MAKLLDNLRSKPPEIRLLVAAILALVTTGIIAAGWIMVPRPERTKIISTSTSSPLNSLTKSITGIIKNDSDESDRVEIIDASRGYDETNPYQQ